MIRSLTTRIEAARPLFLGSKLSWVLYYSLLLANIPYFRYGATLFVRHLCLSPPLAFAFVPLHSALGTYIPGFCACGVAQ